jgi:multiple sugar transport system ATP-binding protein
VAGFIGSPKMNFIPAKLVAAGESLARVQLPTGEILEAQVDARGLQPGEAVTLGIRPEDAETGNATQHLVREVQWQERLGEVTYLYLHSGKEDDPWVVKAPGNAHARPGHRVAVSIPASVLHVFDASGEGLPRCVEDTDLLVPQAA